MAEIDLGKVTLSEAEKAEFMLRTGGTFTGSVLAYDTVEETPQIRNISFSNVEPTELSNGQIVMVYE